MSDRERREGEEAHRPRIKITDRRVMHRDEEPAPAHAGAEPSGGASSASASGASGFDSGSESRSAPSAPADTGAVERGELERARREAKEYLDHARRLQAEFDNYRKRVLKEQTRAVELASEPLVRRLLEVVDDFELALMAAEEKPDFERFRKGVELVYAKFVDALKAEGLERIEAEGVPFDPAQHEALMQTGEGEGDPTVGDVLRQGYRLNGHVIRPAGVRVERA
jgi:molecular chaperone GrpE